MTCRLRSEGYIVDGKKRLSEEPFRALCCLYWRNIFEVYFKYKFCYLFYIDLFTFTCRGGIVIRILRRLGNSYVVIKIIEKKLWNIHRNKNEYSIEFWFLPQFSHKTLRTQQTIAQSRYYVLILSISTLPHFNMRT